MSPVSLDVPPTPGAPSSLYHPDAAPRDRYPPEGYYPTTAHPGQIRSQIRVSSFLIFYKSSKHLLNVCVKVLMSYFVPSAHRRTRMAAPSPALITCTVGVKSC